MIPLNILLLEDNVAATERLLAGLRRAGYEPTTTRAETEAAFAAQLQPTLDLIIASDALPSFNPLRALDVLRASALDVPFILVARASNEDLALQALRRGADDYVFEDRMARLEPAVARALEQRRLRAEKRQAEQVLHDSERRFRALIQKCSDGIALLSADGTILYDTDSVARVLGYALTDSMERNIFDSIHPDDLAAAQSHFAEVLSKAGVRLPHRWRLRHKDGSLRWMEVEATNLLDDESVHAIVVNFRDITGRAQAQETLRTREEIARGLFEFSPDAIVLTNSDDRIERVNLQTEMMFGYGRAELIGKPIEMLFPKWLHAQHNGHRNAHERRTDDTAAHARGSDEELDLLARRKHGGKFPIRVTLNHVHFGDEQFVMGVIRDVSERKQAEQALQTTERRFRAVIENSSDGVALIGDDGAVVYTNPTLGQLLGYAPEESMGRNAFELVHPDDKPLITAQLQRLLEEPAQSVTAQFRVRQKDGTWRWLESVGKNLLAEPGVHAVVANSRDISQRKQAERALRASEERFAKVFQASPVGNLIVSTDERVVDANERFLQMLEYTRDEVVGHGAQELNVLVDLNMREQITQLMRAQRQVSDLEMRFRRKSGETGVALLAVELVTLGEQTCALVILQDITERIRAEELAHEADRRAVREYQQLLERLVLLALHINAARDTRGIFRALVDFVQVSMPCNGLFASLYDPAGDVRTCLYAWSEGAEVDVSTLPPMPMNDSPHSRAVRTGEIVVTNDFDRVMGELPRVHLGLERNPRTPQSSLAAPMAILGKIIGACEVQSVELNAFNTEHVAAMRMAANLAAMAVENIHLVEHERALRVIAETSEREVARYLAQLTTLYEFTHELTALDDLPTLLQTIMQGATRLFASHGCAIYLYDTFHDDLYVAAATTRAGLVGKRMALRDSMAEHVAQTRQPLIVDDYQRSEYCTPQFADLPFGAVLQVPMIYQAQLIGVLSVSYLQGDARRFNYDDAHLLALFAAHAASAVRSANLLREARQRAEQLASCTRRRARLLRKQICSRCWTPSSRARSGCLMQTAAPSICSTRRNT